LCSRSRRANFASSPAAASSSPVASGIPPLRFAAIARIFMASARSNSSIRTIMWTERRDALVSGIAAAGTAPYLRNNCWYNGHVPPVGSGSS